MMSIRGLLKNLFVGDVTINGSFNARDAKPYMANNNIMFGYQALNSATTANGNVAHGYQSMYSATTAYNNVAVGYSSLYSATTGGSNIAVGVNAMRFLTTGSNNTATGYNAARLTTTGQNNTAIGYAALYTNTTYNNNTAVGRSAMELTDGYNNSSALGYTAAVTGSNQVQLGNSSTTTYAYGAVQNRSDARDKADIVDTDLGLEFINALRPVKYRWDYREDYANDLFQSLNPDDFEDDEAYRAAVIQQKAARNAFFTNPVKDGSKKRTRYHQGLIAQEVKEVLDDFGVDWAGYQDHSHNGGMDVKSVGYSELIPPLIKAIQTLSARLAVLEAMS